MQQTQSPKAGERTQTIERTPEDTARFHDDMKRIHESHRTQHTPGPWIIHPGSPSIVREKGNDCIVADHCAINDARLIAAAPELLSELTKTNLFLIHVVSVLNLGESPVRSLLAGHINLNAAIIAKTKGANI